MKPKSRELLEKLDRMIKAATLQDAPIIERYISLANKRLRKEEAGNLIGLVGVSLVIRFKYQRKFGLFVPRSEGVSI